MGFEWEKVFVKGLWVLIVGPLIALLMIVPNTKVDRIKHMLSSPVVVG